MNVERVQPFSRRGEELWGKIKTNYQLLSASGGYDVRVSRVGVDRFPHFSIWGSDIRCQGQPENSKNTFHKLDSIVFPFCHLEKKRFRPQFCSVASFSTTINSKKKSFYLIPAIESQSSRWDDTIRDGSSCFCLFLCVSLFASLANIHTLFTFTQTRIQGGFRLSTLSQL